MSRVHKHIEKTCNRESQTCYYFNAITGTMSNSKLILLHDGDLDFPKHKWKQRAATNAKETVEINNIFSAEEQA